MIVNPVTPLHALDGDIILRLGLAALIGTLLGIDRELKGNPAGMRTHGLVCFTAAAMTLSVMALYYQLGGSDSRADPLRIIEGAGAFVGIVAAGLIVVSGGQVKNLTTAVHIWLAAVIGIACGAAQWPLVAMGSLVAVVMLSFLRILEIRWINRQQPPPEL